MYKSLLFFMLFIGLGVVLPVQGLLMKNIKDNANASGTNAEGAFVKLKASALYEKLALKQTGLAEDVFQKGLLGYLNLAAEGELTNKGILTIIDFAKPSTQKRMWVIDLEKKKLLYNTLVAHGRNTGDNLAKAFSNKTNSHQSSLGFYLTDQTYTGKHGLSLKLIGKDPGFNTNALARAVVIHGADYVSDDFVKTHGRLGRSHGCPALPLGMHKPIIEKIKNKSCLFIHYPATNYYSKFLELKGIAFYLPVIQQFI